MATHRLLANCLPSTLHDWRRSACIGPDPIPEAASTDPLIAPATSAYCRSMIRNSVRFGSRAKLPPVVNPRLTHREEVD